MGGTPSIAAQRLEHVAYGSRLLHGALDELWEDLPTPTSKRAVVVIGFANVVRQHTKAQYTLIQSGLDVSASALVRLSYETLLRTVWALKGAEDAWIDDFLTAPSGDSRLDGETRMGPNVAEMLRAIALHHPPFIHVPLEALKKATWRGMHSYVHGGIRAVAQGSMPFPHQEMTSVLINANGMLVMATNAVRMAHRLPSPTLPTLYAQYADCLPVDVDSGTPQSDPQM